MEYMKDHIFVALDIPNLSAAEPLVKELTPFVGCFKIGLELITSVGAPKAVEFIHALGGKVFYDGKFDDIPNTVGAAAKAVTCMEGVEMFNVHASAGIKAMTAAVRNKGNAKVLAVTVLTSLNDVNSQLIFGDPSKAKVLQFARDAKIAGCDGIICSPQDLAMITEHEELRSLIKVTPGVRPVWAQKNDQERAMTPGDAVRAGSNYLVIGRPLTNPPEEVESPSDAAGLIIDEITQAIMDRGGR